MSTSFSLRLILTCLIFSFAHHSLSQEINIYKTFGGFRFERDSVSLSPKMVMNILEENQQAYVLFKKARSNYSVASVLGFAGGVLIGLPLGTAIGGGNPEWGLAAGGVGLLVISIPFTAAFKNHAIQALDIYNSNLSASRNVKLRFALAGTGGRLVLTF